MEMSEAQEAMFQEFAQKYYWFRNDERSSEIIDDPSSIEWRLEITNRLSELRELLPEEYWRYAQVRIERGAVPPLDFKKESV